MLYSVVQRTSGGGEGAGAHQEHPRPPERGQQGRRHAALTHSSYSQQILFINMALSGLLGLNTLQNTR
jgi:hypothetical protein